MEIRELKNKIEEQRKKNIELFNSIPVPSREDPTNKKADPILAEWREGSKKIKYMIKELQELERVTDKKTQTNENNKTFINSFGEATKRNISCSTYDNTQKRNAKEILSFIGG